jgi:uncharacterized membrane protein YfcA
MDALGSLPVEVLFLIIVIVFLGGLIKGFLGFGMPLFATPLLALFMPLLSVIPMMAVPVLASNIYQAKFSKKSLEYVKRFWPLGLGQIIGVSLGVQVLVSADSNILKIGLGIIVLINIVLRTTKWKFKIPQKKEGISGPLGGLTAGFVGGTTSFVGPLLVLYLSSLENLKKDDFVKAIALLYLAGFLPMYGGLAVLGSFSLTQLMGSFTICVPMLVGIWIGERMRSRVSEALFERAVMITLGCIAISLIYRSSINLLGL